MTRTAVLRASALFVLLTLIFGAVNLGSHALAAEAISVVSGALFLVTLSFSLCPLPTRAALPARILKRAVCR